MGTTLFYSYSVPATNCSSFQSIFYHSLRPPILLHVLVRTTSSQGILANNYLGYIRGIPLSYPYLLAFITFPICAFKNWINVIQMINAAKALAEVDKDERENASLVTPSSRPKRSTAGKKSRIDD
jgi:hypothetical protein